MRGLEIGDLCRNVLVLLQGCCAAGMANNNVFMVTERKGVNFSVLGGVASIYVTCQEIIQSLKNTALSCVFFTPSSLYLID